MRALKYSQMNHLEENRVLTDIPSSMDGLMKLAMNNMVVMELRSYQLFKYIDTDLWFKSRIYCLLNNVSQERLLG